MNFAESGSISICQKPELASSFVKCLAPASCAISFYFSDNTFCSVHLFEMTAFGIHGKFELWPVLCTYWPHLMHNGGLVRSTCSGLWVCLDLWCHAAFASPFSYCIELSNAFRLVTNSLLLLLYGLTLVNHFGCFF